jgi:DNA-binding NarL/FixJ family response regulator
MVRDPQVLLVDCNALFRQAIGDVITGQLPSVTVSEASDATQALDLAEHRDFDFILMAIGIDGEKGLALVRRIRANQSKATLMVVADNSWPEYGEILSLAGIDYFRSKTAISGGEIIDLLLQSISKKGDGP